MMHDLLALESKFGVSKGCLLKLSHIAGVYSTFTAPIKSIVCDNFPNAQVIFTIMLQSTEHRSMDDGFQLPVPESCPTSTILKIWNPKKIWTQLALYQQFETARMGTQFHRKFKLLGYGSDGGGLNVVLIWDLQRSRATWARHIIPRTLCFSCASEGQLEWLLRRENGPDPGLYCNLEIARWYQQLDPDTQSKTQ